MPPRSIDKDEQFVQNLNKGMPQTEAYKAAGFKGGPECASRKMKDPRIQKRMGEVYALKAYSSAIDRQWVLDELVKTHRAAYEDKQYGASSHCLKLIGVELGMFIERKDVRVHAIFEQVPDLELMQQAELAQQQLLSIAKNESSTAE